MNSKPRRFLIKTSFCELKIFWNSTVVFGHCAVLLALLLIGLLGINPTIKHGCFVIFCVYIVVMIFLLCKSASIEDITDKKKPASKPVKQSVVKEEKKPQEKKEPEIKNKVESPVKEEVKEETEKDAVIKTAEEMTDEEWMEFFRTD